MIALLALFACTGSDDGPVYTDDTGDTYVPWPEDTDDTGTDEDGDGWSVEEGDCDDDDIYVHPGWDESGIEGNADDGKDNDCDGRVDEDFRGLVVLQQGDGETASRIVYVDDFGETEAEIMLDDPALVPYFMTEAVDGQDWVVGTLGTYDDREEQYALWLVDSESGATSLIADFSDSKIFEQGMWGCSTHPDGYYVVTTGDGLYTVEPGTGAQTQIASYDIENEMYAFDVYVDDLSGDIGVFGLYGGFALYDSSLGGEVLKTYDPKNIEYVFWSGNRWDEGGWYAGGQDADGWAIFRFNESQVDWVRKVSFDQDWTPHFMTVDSVYGGFYISTTDATYPVVWEVDEDDQDPSQFFQSPYNVNAYQLWELYTRY